MSDPETTDRTAPPDLRERLLPDHAYEEEIAAALNCSRRTVQRMELPFKRIRKRRAYSISGSRETLQRRA